MHLDDESRGNLVGAFIVEEGDEVMSITQSGQVVRTEVDESLRPLGRSTKGVAFVRLRNGDAVAVVARSVEGKVVEEEPLEEATVPDTAEGRCRGDRRRIAGCGPGCNNRGIAG